MCGSDAAERGSEEPARRRVVHYPAFVRLWLADSASWFGTFTFMLALQFLLIEQLRADQFTIGVVRAAQWLPTLLVGLLAGVLIDRLRRRPVLVVADTAAAVLLALIAGLAIADRLTVPLLTVLVFGVGLSTVFFIAAHQSYVPQLVPTSLLPVANARLEQAMTAAETTGPVLAGALIRLVGAPVSIAVNAATHLWSALLIATSTVAEERPDRSTRTGLWPELRQGAAWVYRHPTLAPYAIGLHVWFFFNSAATTIMVYYLAVDLALDPLTIGIVLACAGATGVLGAGLAPRAGARWGHGRVCVLSDWLTPLAWTLVVLARPGAGGVAVLVLAQLGYGLSMGLKGPLETSYRNTVTPHRLRGRMNATIRTLNWGPITVAAPLAGLAAATWGNRPVLLIVVLGLIGAASIVTFSPFRTAVMPAQPPHSTEP